jgi:hypothetical protein
MFKSLAIDLTFYGFQFISLIWKLFHDLKRIADKSKLSRFLLNLMKKYGRSMLSEDQVKWIVNAKLEGKLTNREIASVQGVSTRRVQQLYSEYKSTGVIHV